VVGGDSRGPAPRHLIHVDRTPAFAFVVAAKREHRLASRIPSVFSNSSVMTDSIRSIDSHLNDYEQVEPPGNGIDVGDTPDFEQLSPQCRSPSVIDFQHDDGGRPWALR